MMCSAWIHVMYCGDLFSTHPCSVLFISYKCKYVLLFNADCSHSETYYTQQELTPFISIIVPWGLFLSTLLLSTIPNYHGINTEPLAC